MNAEIWQNLGVVMGVAGVIWSTLCLSRPGKMGCHRHLRNLFLAGILTATGTVLVVMSAMDIESRKKIPIRPLSPPIRHVSEDYV